MLSYKDAKEFEEFFRRVEDETSMANAQLVMQAACGIMLLELVKLNGGVDKPTKEELAEEKAKADVEVETPPAPEPEKITKKK